MSDEQKKREPANMADDTNIIGRTLTPEEIFEIKAAVFLKMTRIMAPGKDQPANFCCYTRDQRETKWKNYIKQYGAIIDATIKETVASVR